MKYLLDTNVLSEPLKKKPDRSLLAKLQLNSGLIATATPVIHELCFGCYRLAPSQKKTNLEIYISEIVISAMLILPYCNEAAQWHARERARLTAIGQTPSFVDGQIAAVAYVNNLTMVTRNIGDFQPFSELKIENWFCQ